jgi:hypothetical protein
MTDKLPKELQDIILYDFLNIKLAYGNWYYKLSFAKIKEFAEKYDKIPKIHCGGHLWIIINENKWYRFHLQYNMGYYRIKNPHVSVRFKLH